MISVRINDTATVRVEELREVLNENCDKVLAEIDIDESFNVNADDLEDVDSSDIVELYNNLGHADQHKVLIALNIQLTDAIEFVPTTVEDQQKFAAFMENKDRFSLEQFIQLLNMKDPIDLKDDSDVLCPYCENYFDVKDHF